MQPSSNLTPPLTPVLLAGIALRPVPAALLQPFLNAAMAVMNRRNKGMFDRISAQNQPVFLIDPIDLPYIFILHPDPCAPRLVVGKSAPSDGVDATIRGPLSSLLAMLEGRIDGDALFFSRDLVIEGDTEAVVALRNAVDDAEIDLKRDFLSLFGHFSKPVTTLVDRAEWLAGQAARDLEILRQAIISPSMRRHEAQDGKLNRISEKLDDTSGKRKRPRKTKA